MADRQSGGEVAPCKQEWSVFVWTQGASCAHAVQLCLDPRMEHFGGSFCNFSKSNQVGDVCDQDPSSPPLFRAKDPIGPIVHQLKHVGHFSATEACRTSGALGS